VLGFKPSDGLAFSVMDPGMMKKIYSTVMLPEEIYKK
jgi:hypothetical protein